MNAHLPRRHHARRLRRDRRPLPKQTQRRCRPSSGGERYSRSPGWTWWSSSSILLECNRWHFVRVISTRRAQRRLRHYQLAGGGLYGGSDAERQGGQAIAVAKGKRIEHWHSKRGQPLLK